MSSPDLADKPDRKPLPDALTYPVREDAKIMLAIGAAIAGLAALAPVGMLAGASMLILTYFNAYYFKIVESTVGGEDEAPDWPDVTDSMDDILIPLLRTGFVWIVSFLPAAAVFYLTEDARGMAGTGLLLITLLWGVFYFPMAILNVIVENESMAALPHRVLPRILSVKGPYLILAGLLGVSLIAAMLMEKVLGNVPFLGALLVSGSALYFSMAQARLAGLFYRNHLWVDGEEDGNERAESVPAPLSGPSGSGGRAV